MNARQLLEQEVYDEFEYLRGLTPGTEEHKVATDSLTKLLDREIELQKIELEKINNKETRDSDDRFRKKQQFDENVDRWIKNGLEVVKFAGGALIVIWGTKATIKFEETGTMTTSAGKSFVNKIFRFMK